MCILLFKKDAARTKSFLGLSPGAENMDQHLCSQPINHYRTQEAPLRNTKQSLVCKIVGLADVIFLQILTVFMRTTRFRLVDLMWTWPITGGCCQVYHYSLQGEIGHEDEESVKIIT